LLQPILDDTALVVDAGVEFQLLDDEIAFRAAAGDAHHAAALQARDLADRLPDRAGRARDHHRVARLRLAHLQQTEVGGHAGHAERIQPLRERADAKVDLVDAYAREILAVDQAILLNAETAADRVAEGKFRILRGDNLTYAARAHHFADADWRNVASPLVHPAAHGRIQRKLQDLYQHLPVGRVGDRFSGECPVAGL